MGCDDFDVEVGDEEGYGGVFVGTWDSSSARRFTTSSTTESQTCVGKVRGRPGSPSRSRGVSSRPASAIAAINNIYYY